MRTCQKCGQPNRNEARYCKWCGTLLEAVAQPSADGNSALPEAADFIAKDNILPTFRSFAARCEHASEFIQLSGGTSRPGLDCIITGNAGTGKIYLADQLCSLLYRYKISDGLKPKHVDAADWDGFNGKLDENLAKIKKGVLLVTNCQDLVGDYKNALDKLFARMRKGTEMPVVILCGLEDGFGSYIRSNKHVSSLFEFSFGLLPFNDAHLTSLCSSIITGKFRTSISPEAQKKLGLVFKKKFRDGMSGENGKLSCRLAEAYTLNKIERCGKNGPLEEADIPDEPFKELTEEEIFEKLDSFVGLKEVKDEIHSIINGIKREKRENPDAKVKLKSHFVFLGNPGTGKTTIARLFAEILNSLQVLPCGHLVEVTRKDLVSQYVGDTAQKTEQVINRAMGGILFIDEAYSLKQSDDDKFGQEAIDTLLPFLENRVGDFICIIAGYTREMTTFLRSNSGLDSRFKRKIDFKDYNGKELKTIFMNMVEKNKLSLDEESESKIDKYFERMYLSRTDTFGNARAVRNVFDACISRQNGRIVDLTGDEYQKQKNLIIWRDIVGDEESEDISVDQVMKELDQFVGMASVKAAIKNLAEEMRFQRRRMEFGGKASIRPVNIILTGNPGTGKTTVARVLGKLFKAMGICSTDRVIEKSRKDIVGRYANESDKEMDKAINEAMGGVLFLDEAYTLAPFDDMGHCNDSEGLKALERLMTRMENDRGKFVLVCAGYKDEMGNLMKANPGFQSRFTHNINIDDYSPEELTEIFRRNCGNQGYTLADGVLEKVLSAFRKIVAEKSGKSFGNAREARNMLDECLGKLGTRVNALPDSEITRDSFFTILPEDIPYEEPKVVSEEECMSELNSLIGLDGVKEEIRLMIEELRQQKLEAEINGTDFKGVKGDHYLFLGNPGTGKTTVARLMGNMLHSLGVLPRPDVIEVSRSDLVAGYSGQTAPKTREVVNKAMGAILFIDEAYSLIQGPHDNFGTECVSELLKLLEDRKGKFVCIAAGYTREMQQFLDSNSGLKSRFNKSINFEDYNADQLMDIFRLNCRKEGYTIDPEAEKLLVQKFSDIYANRSFDFGNAREVRNIFREVKSAAARRANARMAELVAGGMDKTEAYRQAQPKLIIKEDIQ